MAIEKSYTKIFFFVVLLAQLIFPFLERSVSAKQAAKPQTELVAKLQAKLDEWREATGLPGMNATILLPNGKPINVSTGAADLEAKKMLMPTDRMQAGSIGKTFVSAVTLLAVEEGKLALDDKIEKWLGKESWFIRLPNAKNLTLRMLMNHSSGIPEHVLHKDFLKALKEQPDKVWKPEELIAFIFDQAPLFEAGKGWSYADTNFIVVGMIYERATGKTVYGEVERRILKPLKLKNTVPSDRRVIPGLITGYISPNSPFGFEGRTIIDGKFVINPQMEWCGGGFVSTAEDLASWAKALYEGKVLKTKMFEQLLNAVPAKTGRNDKYGLGVQVRESNWGMSYGHGGWFPGYLSEMEYFPQQKTSIAVQVNTDNFRQLKRSTHAMIYELAKIIFSEPVR